jgi:hypothetical protein
MYVKPENDKTWQAMKIFVCLGLAIYLAYQLYDGYSTGTIRTGWKGSSTLVSYQNSPGFFVTSVVLHIVFLLILGGTALSSIRRIRRLMARE